MERFFDLSARYDSRKSFYGKAKVIERAGGLLELLSYNTIVCSLRNGTHFQLLWDGSSQTTTRHIREFVKQFAKQPEAILRSL